MRAGGKRIWILGYFLANAAAYGVTPEPSANPFQHLAVSNIFRLHAPVGPIIPPPAKRALPPITVTGILDGFGKTLAFLEMSLPGNPKTYLTMKAGQHEGEIGVLSIDVKTGVVTATVFGTVTNLTLNSANPAPAALAASSGQPRVALTTPSFPAQPLSGLNRDEAALVIEAERARLNATGDVQANLIPPTHLTPRIQAEHADR